MTVFRLDDKVRLSVELALTPPGGDPLLLRRQEDAARAVGMTGAEIDVARRGWSFDVRASTAIALALSASDDNRRRARRAGLCDRSCAEIERLAAAIRQSRSDPHGSARP